MTRKLYFGIHEPDDSGEWRYLKQFSKEVIKPDIAHWFVSQRQDALAMLPVEKIRSVSDMGMLPLITWEIYKPSDEHVRNVARRLRKVDRTICLRIYHEFNGDWYPWSVKKMGPHVLTHHWRRIVRIFTKEGADNVFFVWCPNVGSVPEEAWPGAKYVDIVGIDGYCHPSYGGWQSFEEKFGATYDRVARYGLPIWICETACHDQGGDKVAWIRALERERIVARFPQVRAIIWFNENKDGRNWRLNSSRERAAMREVVLRWR